LELKTSNILDLEGNARAFLLKVANPEDGGNWRDERVGGRDE
jgi:hypothetical protein